MQTGGSRSTGKLLMDRGSPGRMGVVTPPLDVPVQEMPEWSRWNQQSGPTLASTIYLAAMGKQGLRQIAELCYHKAHYAAARIAELPGYSLPLSGTFFQEFVIQCPNSPAGINQRLLEQNILGGWDLTAWVFSPPSSSISGKCPAVWWAKPSTVRGAPDTC